MHVHWTRIVVFAYMLEIVRDVDTRHVMCNICCTLLQVPEGRYRKFMTVYRHLKNEHYKIFTGLRTYVACYDFIAKTRIRARYMEYTCMEIMSSFEEELKKILTTCK